MLDVRRSLSFLLVAVFIGSVSQRAQAELCLTLAIDIVWGVRNFGKTGFDFNNASDEQLRHNARVKPILVLAEAGKLDPATNIPLLKRTEAGKLVQRQWEWLTRNHQKYSFEVHDGPKHVIENSTFLLSKQEPVGNIDVVVASLISREFVLQYGITAFRNLEKSTDGSEYKEHLDYLQEAVAIYIKKTGIEDSSAIYNALVHSIAAASNLEGYIFEYAIGTEGFNKGILFDYHRVDPSTPKGLASMLRRMKLSPEDERLFRAVHAARFTEERRDALIGPSLENP